MKCIDDNTAAELLDGVLSAARARAVEEHAAGCGSCRQLLAELARASNHSTDPHAPTHVDQGESPTMPASAPSMDLKKGDTVGRFLILNRLGAGGMGVVFGAYDPKLDRKVAIKLLRSGEKTGLASHDAQTRLLREAQAIAQLGHPNVIAVYDVGTFRNEVYIAMELVDGETMTRWVRRWDRPWREVLDRFIQAGRALQHAHGSGMVHRDFKPDNVLVGADERVRVMDFGLARSLFTGGHWADGSGVKDLLPEVRDALDRTLTRTGTLVGTPRYMAPEQFLGRETDARSDQFSFCVALYEALCGQHPFAGETALDLVDEKGGVRPVPAGRSVPGWLWKVLLRGLEKDPQKRFASMAALLDDATPPRPSGGRAPYIVLGVGAAVVAVVLGATMILRSGEPAAQSLPAVTIAERDRLVEVEKELETARHERNLVIEKLREVRDENARDDETIRELSDELQARIARIDELEQEAVEAKRREKDLRDRLVPPGPGAEIAGVLGDPPPPGGLSNRDVAAVLARSRTDIDVCLREWADRHPESSVSVTINFQIAPRGRLYTHEIKGNAGTEVLGQCLLGAVDRSTFGESTVITLVEASFRLHADNETEVVTRVTGTAPPPPLERPLPAMSTPG